MATIKGQKVVEIDVDLLQPNPLQPRGVITPESLVDLVDSIREHGILEPLVVAETPAGFQIIAGERRWRAAKIAGLKKVPAIIKKTTPRGMLEMALVENVQREDLNPLERAKAFKRLISEFKLTPLQIAQKIGKSTSYVNNSLRLLDLPDLLKDGLLSGQTTEGHVRALSSLKDPKLIVEAYKEVLKKNLSVRGAEELTRRIKAREKIQGYGRKTTEGYKLVVSPRLDKMEEELSQSLTQLGCPSQVRIAQSQVRTRVLFFIKGNQGKTDKILKFLYERITGKSLEE